MRSTAKFGLAEYICDGLALSRLAKRQPERRGTMNERNLSLGRAKRYRDQSEELRRIADDMNCNIKKELNQVADEYDKMAEREEKGK